MIEVFARVPFHDCPFHFLGERPQHNMCIRIKDQQMKLKYFRIAFFASPKTVFSSKSDKTDFEN